MDFDLAQPPDLRLQLCRRARVRLALEAQQVLLRHDERRLPPPVERVLVRGIDELQPMLQTLRCVHVGRLRAGGRRVCPSLPDSGEGAHEAAAAARRALAVLLFASFSQHVRRDLQRAKGVLGRELSLALCTLWHEDRGRVLVPRRLEVLEHQAVGGALLQRRLLRPRRALQQALTLNLLHEAATHLRLKQNRG